MKKIVLLLTLLLFLEGLLIHLSYSSNRIVAVVNEDIITKKELRDYLSLVKFKLSLVYKEDKEKLLEAFKEERSKALDRLIEDKLLIQQAKENNIEIPEKLIEKRLKEYSSTFRDRAELKASLREKGLTIASLKQKIKEQFLIQRLIDREIRKKIEITPSEVTSYYRLHLKEFNLPLSIEYKALKFPSQLEANQAYQELKEATSSEEIINKYSQNLIKGRLNEDQARKELKNIFKLKEKEVSSPIGIEGEFLIFIIEKKNPSREASLEEVKEKIWEDIYKEKFKRKLTSFLKKLKEKAIIKKYPLR